jgi:hypothetical protein
MPPELAQYGLAGLVIFTLSGVVVFQQRRIDKIQIEKDAIQDKRLQDIIDLKDKYEEVVKAFSQTSSLLLAKLSGKGE